MVLGPLDQLQIFSQLYLIELLGLLTGLIFGLISSFLSNRRLRVVPPAGLVPLVATWNF